MTLIKLISNSLPVEVQSEALHPVQWHEGAGGEEIGCHQVQDEPVSVLTPQSWCPKEEKQQSCVEGQGQGKGQAQEGLIESCGVQFRQSHLEV